MWLPVQLIRSTSLLAHSSLPAHLIKSARFSEDLFGISRFLTNFEDGLTYMRIIEATQRSRLEGRAVDLSEV